MCALVVILPAPPTIAATTTLIQGTMTPYSTFPPPTPTPTYSPAQATFVAQESCLHTFDEFAYHAVINPVQTSSHPPAGWLAESTVPHEPDAVYWGNPVFAVQISRTVDGVPEIWLRGRHQDRLIWLIYQPELQTWEIVPRDIENTVFYTSGLFVTTDGAVWSKIRWMSFNELLPDSETAPLLSRFNETTRRFEIPEGTPELPYLDYREIYQQNPGYYWPAILLDNQDVFWVFAHLDGIFRYDPSSQTFEEQVDLPDLLASGLALAPDGSIYFSSPSKYGITARDRLALSEDRLSQFIPGTTEIISIDVPDEPWPYWESVLFDQSGRLWLGIPGYRDVDSTWHLIFPDPEVAFDHVSDLSWIMPTLLFESSNGRLWYYRFADGRGDGVAWYDPEIGEGCQITDYPSTVIEDSQQQLWMLAGNTLYRYPLNP